MAAETKEQRTCGSVPPHTVEEEKSVAEGASLGAFLCWPAWSPSSLINSAHLGVPLVVSRYTLWSLMSADNFSVLLGKDLTSPIMMEGRRAL